MKKLLGDRQSNSTKAKHYPNCYINPPKFINETEKCGSNFTIN